MNRILFGPAKSGKTHRIIEEFLKSINDKELLLIEDYFIVPTREHSKRIEDLLLKDIDGFIGKRVLTFNEFFETILHFDKFQLKSITQAVKLILINQAIDKSNLKFYKDTIKYPGFIIEFASFISELKHGMITPEVFQASSKEVSDRIHNKRVSKAFILKTEDMANIYCQYENMRKKNQYLDYEDLQMYYLDFLRKDPDYIKNKGIKSISFDGFIDFSPLQIEIIKSLSTNINITLPFEKGERAASLFQASYRTYQNLKEAGFVEEEILISRDSGNALEHVADQLFKAKPRQIDAGSEIQICATASKYNEIRYIANTILKNMNQHKDSKWQDYCLIMRSLDSYRTMIESIFSEYEIPLHVHQGRLIECEPIVKFLLTVIDILGGDFSHNNLMRLMQSEYFNMPIDSIYSIQKLMIEEEREGIDFWEQISKEDKKVHIKLQRIIEAHKATTQLRKSDAFKAEIKNLLRALEVQKSIRKLYSMNSNRESMDFYALSIFLKTLDTISSNAGKGEMSFSQYKNIIYDLLKDLRLSTKEKETNCVQAYDVFLSREKSYKHVFVIGLVEKEFPKELKSSPFLNDEERHSYRIHGRIGLKEIASNKAIERYHFYNAVNRAEEKLYLTYPRYNIDGGENLPSFFINEMKKTFSETDTDNMLFYEETDQIFPIFDHIALEKDLKEYMLYNLTSTGVPNDDIQYAKAIWNHYLKDKSKYIKHLIKIHEIDYFNISFNKLVIEKIKKSKQFFSATELERYAKCPFAYFVEKVLKIKNLENEESGKYMKRGVLVHDILFSYFKKQKITYQNNLCELLNFSDTFFEKNAMQYYDRNTPCHILHFEKKHIHYLIENFIELHAKRTADQNYKVKHVEWSFGTSKYGEKKYQDVSSTNEYFVIGKEKNSFCGAIDRIDSDGEALNVIDYKTGTTEAKYIQRISDGKKFQLPIYMLAVENLLGKKVKEGVELGLKEIRERAISMDEVRLMEEKILDYIAQYTSRIKGGQFTNAPNAKQCEDVIPNCPNRPLCRRENWQENQDHEQTNT